MTLTTQSIERRERAIKRVRIECCMQSLPHGHLPTSFSGSSVRLRTGSGQVKWTRFLGPGVKLESGRSV